MKLSRLLVAFAFSAAAVPAAAQLRLDLNIPENRLRVLDGDSLVRTYRVSVGTPGHDTPDGSFTVERAEWNPSWRPPADREWARGKEFMPPGPNNPMGRVKLFFMPLYYIHGTPDSASIGQPASHGCVRMRNRDVVELARLLHEHAQPTVAPAEIDGILRRSSTTRWSSFRAPVPLVIRYDPVVVENDEVRVYPDFYNRSRIHTEGVIQALLAAGYEANSIDRAQIRALLQRARQARGPVTAKLADAFTGLRRATGTVDR
ncbi:MAG TPA: L,D-transpeptidase [Longimicrobium sp.]|uniref:L,D-transpeptidase n=1 Tax=Longimicrobium sp. TaxID=2029185 RepID=UPI002ED84EC7